MPKTPYRRPAKRQKREETPQTDIEDDENDEESCNGDLDITEVLPDDLLGTIFFGGYLNTLEVVKVTSVISKNFQRLASLHVKMLDLRRIQDIPVAHLVKRFRNVERLDLSYCQHIQDPRLLKQLRLKVLSMRSTPVLHADLLPWIRGKNAKYLEELDLSSSRRDILSAISDVTVQRLAKQCPNLRRLKLGWRRGVTNKSLNHLARLSKLQELDLSLTSVTDVKPLSAFQSLERLDLSACQIEELEHLFPSKKPFSKMTHLYLRFVRNLEPHMLAVLLPRAPQLQVLNIENCGFTRDSCMRYIHPLQTQRGVHVIVDSAARDDSMA